ILRGRLCNPIDHRLGRGHLHVRDGKIHPCFLASAYALGDVLCGGLLCINLDVALPLLSITSSIAKLSLVPSVLKSATTTLASVCIVCKMSIRCRIVIRSPHRKTPERMWLHERPRWAGVRVTRARHAPQRWSGSSGRREGTRQQCRAR